MRKYLGWVRVSLVVLVCLIFIYILINIFFNNRVNSLQNIGLLLLFCVIFGVIVGLLCWLTKKIMITKKKVAIVMGILILAQLGFAALFAVNPSWDFGGIYNMAVKNTLGVEGIFSGTDLYGFNNNIAATLLLSLVFKVAHFFNIEHFYIIGVLLNILFIDISIWFLYRILKILFSRRKAFLFLILTVIFAPLILYVPIFYIDTLSMAFSIVTLYLFFKHEYTDHKSKYDLWLAGILVGIGACIKITVLFVGIAIIFGYLFSERREKRFEKIKNVSVIVVMIFIPLLMINLYTKLNTDSARMYELQIPYTHWVMMGMTGIGGYEAREYQYTFSFDNVDDRREANIKVIKTRLREFITDGSLVPFYTTKLIFTWGDGTFFALHKLNREPLHQYEISEYLYGQKNIPLKYFCQAEWVFVIIFMILGCVFRKYLNKEQRDLQFILCVLCFGLIVFLLIWETRSRYLVNMLPVFLLMGFLGMQATYEFSRRDGKELGKRILDKIHKR